MSEHAVLLAALIALSSCRIPIGASDAAIVQDFQFEPEAFDSFVGVSRARYRLSQASVTALSILRLSDDGSRSVVITLFENLSEAGGRHEHVWLGDTAEGTFAPSGTYVAVLTAGSERYETVVRVYHR